MTFKELNLLPSICDTLAAEGYQHPTPIQQQAITPILEGRDVLGCAQTGTGKTAAFALPIIQQLHTANNKKPGIKVLILSPTRELAIQISESITAYARGLNVRNEVVVGGVGINPQITAVRRLPEILVATPGRLLDLVGQGAVTLANIKTFVLDEADRMLDMGFIHDIRKVVAKLPTERQSLFFSATMPPPIKKLADTILNRPVEVSVTPPSRTADRVAQEVYFVEPAEKKHTLINLLMGEPESRSLVFTRTKHGADKLVKFLDKSGITAAAIHGNKSQGARQRALGDFKSSRIKVLVATDIAARGIDIDELEFVVNYEIPEVPETYVHRIGRTGRAGNAGKAVSLCDAEERADWRNIEKLIGLKIPVAKSAAINNN